MKTEKLTVLENAMDDILNNEIIADGEDGYMHETLHIEMAKAAAAVYDSCMGGQAYTKREDV